MKTVVKNVLPVVLFLISILFVGSAYSEPEMDFTWLKNELAQANFSGSIIVAKEHQVIFRESFGYANREEKLPFDTHTVFDIGSVTKQFLATAIVKLSEEKKLSIQDNLAAYFENVPKDKTSITLHHLLTHTSGLPTNLSDHQLYDIVPYEQLPRLAFKETLTSSPGETYRYSNVGYSLLARIIEKVSGQNWETFLLETVFKPSGMLSTGYRLPEYRSEHLAVNYGADQSTFQKIFSIEPKSRSVGHSLAHLYQAPGERWMEGAGGLMSTIDDMYRWYLTLSAQAIVSKASWDAIFTPYIREGEHSHYGYGWAISVDEQGRRLIAHNGSNGYSFADFKYYPDENLFIFVATNDIDNYPEDTFKKLSKAVFDSDKSKTHSMVIRDTQRDRTIPLQVNFPTSRATCSLTNRCKVAFLSAGNKVPFTKYQFVTQILKQSGYMTVAVDHERPDDPPLSRTGDLYQTRIENWLRGAHTLDFLQKKLANLYPSYDFSQLTLVGHSNGGDISSWLANEGKSYIFQLITLDHKRVPLPRDKNINILSINATEYPTKPGVLPDDAEQAQYGMCVVEIVNSKHMDLSDFGSEQIKDKASTIISGFVDGESCEELKSKA